MKQKFLAVLLTAVMAAQILAGCGSKTSGNNVQEPAGGDAGTVADQAEEGAAPAGLDTSTFVTINGYLIGSPNTDFELMQDELNKKLKEDLNCEMKVTFIDWGVLSSKYPLALAGEECDWIFTGDWCYYASEAAKHAFLELTPEMISQYMPLEYAAVSEEGWKQCNIKDKCYMIPSPTPDIKGQGFVIRKDLADKYGVDTSKIKTIWDLDEYLAAVKQNEPTIIPINMNNGYDKNKLMFALISAQGAYINDYNQGLFQAFCGTDEMPDDIYAFYDDEMVEKIQKASAKIKEWYDKGYINQDALAATTASEANFENGISAVSFSNSGGGLQLEEKCIAQGWEVLRYYGSSIEGHQARNAYTNNGVAVSAMSKNPERTMAALDLLINDPDYVNLLTYGVEGIHYVINDEGVVDYPEGFNNNNTRYDWSNNGWWFLNKDIKLKCVNETQAYLDDRDNLLENILIEDPAVAFIFDTDPVKTEFANVQNVLTQYWDPLCVGNVKDVDAALEELNKQLSVAGYEKVMEEAKRQFAEYMKAYS